ncbi:MAG TPA: 16S rRNA (cytidine(1402)-2'-O)-methyltransferase [Micrococcales bacterium]|nr:16S rRNA (cytidine(1402)-2'-O)-methyltransferase [Miniimonas arenae]HCX84875.1 16S rRNA (cytidine(1402)-2'-O)-methyltransferase [Micrococcales bacterium]
MNATEGGDESALEVGPEAGPDAGLGRASDRDAFLAPGADTGPEQGLEPDAELDLDADVEAEAAEELEAELDEQLEAEFESQAKPDAARWRGLGKVVLAATPIGSARDATQNLRDLLAEADVVAAEDTRTLRELLRRIGVTPSGTLVSYHEHNERERAEELVARAAAGATVAVVTDAGMPSVSDPGYRVTVAAHEAGVPVTALPGPSAVLTALAVSGLPSDRFSFEGFVPRRPGERRRLFAELATERRTMVLFSSPHRVADELADLAAAFGATRPAAVCRELTKRYEEVRRGGLAELADWATAGVRGEITLVVGGATQADGALDGRTDASALAARALELAAGGLRLKDAAAVVAEGAGVSKREVYEAALAARPAP